MRLKILPARIYYDRDRRGSFPLAGNPVQDHTGLTGRYDLTLNWIDDPDSKEPPGFVSSDDPEPLSHWDFDARSACT